MKSKEFKRDGKLDIATDLEKFNNIILKFNRF